MPIDNTLNLLKLMTSMVKDREITKPIVERMPGKTRIMNDSEHIFLERSTPEEQGVDKKMIDSFVSECSMDDSVHLNRLLVTKNSRIIYEYCEKPYQIKSWDYVFSFTKSIIGFGIGILIDQKKLKLSDKAYDILLKGKQISNLQNKKITIKNLLTMSTGSKFSETSSAVSKEWIRDFFNSGNKFKIGSAFEYNSLNSYILSAVIDKVTGSTSDFLKEYLFDPLDITDYCFEKSPEGIEKGGWGLYLCPDDMAKLGVMVYNKGLYGGKRIVSSKWIEQMSTMQMDVKRKGQNFDYGYHMWCNKEKNVCCMNGMFNQDTIIYKNTGFIITWCCSNNDGFHTNNIFNIANKYFCYKNPVWEMVEYKKQDIISDPTAMIPLEEIFNKELVLENEKGIDTTILPIVLQMSLNFFSSGLKSLYIKKYKTHFGIKFREKDCTYEIKYSTESEMYQVLNLYGNMYEISARGFYRRNDLGETYLLIRVNFLEFSSVRFIKIHLTPKSGIIAVKFRENPGMAFLFSLLDYQDKQTERFISLVKKNTREETIVSRIGDFLYPSFNMVVKADKDFLESQSENNNRKEEDK